MSVNFFILFVSSSTCTISDLWRKARAAVYNMLFQMGLTPSKITYYEVDPKTGRITSSKSD
jgi:hypothetical protein